jgi:hypothetical protein
LVEHNVVNHQGQNTSKLKITFSLLVNGNIVHASKTPHSYIHGFKIKYLNKRIVAGSYVEVDVPNYY